jgi:hypothetical protein
MTIEFPTKVLIAGLAAIVASASLVLAETTLTTGEIKKIIGPDELQLDPDAVVIAIDVFGDEEKNRDRNYLLQHDRVKEWSNEKSKNRRGSWSGGELSSSDVAGDRGTFHL